MMGGRIRFIGEVKVDHDDNCGNREMDVVTHGDEDWLCALCLRDRVFRGSRIG